MAQLLQASRRSLIPWRNALISHLRTQFPLHPNEKTVSFSSYQFCRAQNNLAQTPQKSPFESNIIRMLGTEIEYQSEYAPPQQPLTKFNAFTVEDRPGEQWITLIGTSTMDEDIKIEATMFDGSVLVPKSGDDTTEDLRLHISLLIDISKGEGADALEFVCSAWPDSLEIQKVYIHKRDKQLKLPYMGPNIRDLDEKLHKALYEFLKARGVNDDLSAFLHQFMMNKDRIEFIQWLRKVKSFVED